MSGNQILANNWTPLRYWEKTRYLAITRVRVFEPFRTGLVFVLRLNTIFGFKYRASTQPRLLAYKIRLENESRVGTLLRRNFLEITI